MNHEPTTFAPCPVCQASDSVFVLEIPSIPVHCNLLWHTREEAVKAPRGTMQLTFCKQCGHVWNHVFDPQLMEYKAEYENSLHFSPTFQKYAKELAHHLVESYHIYEKDIVEIGSGQGDFLRLLCNLGRNRGVGFDPSYVPEDGEEHGRNVRFVQDFYSEKYASTPADLICCRHTLEHIANPHDMLASVRAAIGERHDTVVFFEVPNALFTVRDLSIWDIIYEHCSYFSAGSLVHAFRANNFAVQEQSDAFNGQFLTIVAKPTPLDAPPAHEPWNGLAQMEQDVATFASHYRYKIAEWSQRLEQMTRTGKKAVVWGAGSKGIMFLNTLPKTQQISYVVDINPRKHGKYCTGTGHQIVPPIFLQNDPPDVIIVMNTIYIDEIRQMIEELGFSATFLRA